MKVTNILDVHEVDDKVSIDSPVTTITVKNHDKHKMSVVLLIDGHEYTVNADDLVRATENACSLMRRNQ